MLKLNSPSENPPRGNRRRQWLAWLLAPVFVGLVILAAERWRGQWELRKWKSAMAAQGGVFEAARLWPPPTPGSLEFSNALAQAHVTLGGRLASYSGSLSAIIVDERGRCRRGSQETRPPRQREDGTTNSWPDLDGLLRQNQAGLQTLRELLKHPPASMGQDIARSLEANDALPSYVAVRIGVQALHVAVINELHRGDLEQVRQDLVTLLAFAKLYEQDPSLVSYMIRMALLSMSVDVGWDALQDPGWTEPQLAALQEACFDTRRLLSQLPPALAGERAVHLFHAQWFRAHSYQAWLDRHRKLYQSFGLKDQVPETAAPWQQWIFHPVWSFAWADQDELEYLRQTQRELTSVREATRLRSWSHLKAQLTTQHQDYRAPAAAWRFYFQIPLVDRLAEGLGAPRLPVTTYPYPDCSRTGFSTMKVLTQHELLITAIALKRYALRHGQPAAHLGLLIPDYLNALPTDYMDGQPLRYVVDASGKFYLYSVGANLRDEAGDSVPDATSAGWSDAVPWNGRDWVWPESEAGR